MYGSLPFRDADFIFYPEDGSCTLPENVGIYICNQEGGSETLKSALHFFEV